MTNSVPGIPTGPVEREPLSYATLGFHAPPEVRERLIRQVLDVAGVELGAHDERVAVWLADADWGTVSTVAGWVQRAGRAGREAGAAAQQPVRNHDAQPDVAAAELGDPRED